MGKKKEKLLKQQQQSQQSPPIPWDAVDKDPVAFLVGAEVREYVVCAGCSARL